LWKRAIPEILAEVFKKCKFYRGGGRSKLANYGTSTDKAYAFALLAVWCS